MGVLTVQQISIASYPAISRSQNAGHIRWKCLCFPVSLFQLLFLKSPDLLVLAFGDGGQRENFRPVDLMLADVFADSRGRRFTDGTLVSACTARAQDYTAIGQRWKRHNEFRKKPLTKLARTVILLRKHNLTND
jgi:hypothetical protein